MNENEKSPGQLLTEAEENKVIKLRSDFTLARNEKRYAVSGHILWVSATVFAVLVVGGHTGRDPLFLVAVALNALCILFCSISLYEPVNSADRSQGALAKLLQGKLKARSGRSERREIHQTDHRGVTIFVCRNAGNTDILLHENKRKIFGICEMSAYVCFILMVFCLAVYTLTR